MQRLSYSDFNIQQTCAINFLFLFNFYQLLTNLTYKILSNNNKNSKYSASKIKSWFLFSSFSIFLVAKFQWIKLVKKFHLNFSTFNLKLF